MTLYTALGIYETEKNKGGQHPVVAAAGERQLVDIPEMVIWASLKNRFLELSQLEKLYNERIAVYGLQDVPACSAYIDRMLQRGLITDGHGDTGHDALYDLLGDLQIVPTTQSAWQRVIRFLRLSIAGRLPLRMTRTLLKKDHLSYCEREIMALCGKVRLSAAEAITCIEQGSTNLASDADVKGALYTDGYTTCDNIAGEARTCRNELPCLTAIANLYLRRHIRLERI